MMMISRNTIVYNALTVDLSWPYWYMHYKFVLFKNNLPDVPPPVLQWIMLKSAVIECHHREKTNLPIKRKWVGNLDSLFQSPLVNIAAPSWPWHAFCSVWFIRSSNHNQLSIVVANVLVPIWHQDIYNHHDEGECSVYIRSVTMLSMLIQSMAVQVLHTLVSNRVLPYHFFYQILYLSMQFLDKRILLLVKQSTAFSCCICQLRSRS